MSAPRVVQVTEAANPRPVGHHQRPCSDQFRNGNPQRPCPAESASEVTAPRPVASATRAPGRTPRTVTGAASATQKSLKVRDVADATALHLEIGLERRGVVHVQVVARVRHPVPEPHREAVPVGLDGDRFGGRRVVREGLLHSDP